MDKTVIETIVTVSDTPLVEETIQPPCDHEDSSSLKTGTLIRGLIVTILIPYYSVISAPGDIILPADTVVQKLLVIKVPVDTIGPGDLSVPEN